MWRQPGEDIEALKKQLRDLRKQNKQLQETIDAKNSKIKKLEDEVLTSAMVFNDLFDQFQSLDLKEVNQHIVDKFRKRYNYNHRDKTMSIFMVPQQRSQDQSDYSRDQQISSQTSYDLTSSIDEQMHFQRRESNPERSRSANRQNARDLTTTSFNYEYLRQRIAEDNYNLSNTQNQSIQQNLIENEIKRQAINVTFDERQFKKKEQSFFQDEGQNSVNNMLQTLNQNQKRKKQQQAEQLQKLIILNKNFNFVVRESLNKYYLDFRIIKDEQQFDDFWKSSASITKKFIYKLVFDLSINSKQFINQVLKQSWPFIKGIYIYSHKQMSQNSGNLKKLLQTFFESPSTPRINDLPPTSTEALISKDYIKASDVIQLMQLTSLNNIKTFGIIGYTIKTEELGKIMQDSKQYSFIFALDLYEISQQTLQFLKSYQSTQISSKIKLNQRIKNLAFQVFPQEDLFIKNRKQKYFKESQICNKMSLMKQLISREQITYESYSSGFRLQFNGNIDLSQIQQLFKYSLKQVRQINFRNIKVDKTVWKIICQNSGNIRNVMRFCFNSNDFYTTGQVCNLILETDMKMFQSLDIILLGKSDEEIDLIGSSDQYSDEKWKNSMQDDTSEGQKQEKRRLIQNKHQGIKVQDAIIMI